MPRDKVDGGPAFPSVRKIMGPDPNFPDGPVYYIGDQINDGLTIRDYFAAKAMEALISQWMRLGQGMLPKHDYSEIAKESYEMSDAMLSAREEKKDA